jgi:hypothetical protein
MGGTFGTKYTGASGNKSFPKLGGLSFKKEVKGGSHGDAAFADFEQKFVPHPTHFLGLSGIPERPRAGLGGGLLHACRPLPP